MSLSRICFVRKFVLEQSLYNLALGILPNKNADYLADLDLFKAQK